MILAVFPFFILIYFFLFAFFDREFFTAIFNLAPLLDVIFTVVFFPRFTFVLETLIVAFFVAATVVPELFEVLFVGFDEVLTFDSIFTDPVAVPFELIVPI